MADKDAQTGTVTDLERKQRREERVAQGKRNAKDAQTGQQQRTVTDLDRALRRKEHREQGEKKRDENRNKEYWEEVKRRSKFREVLRL